MMKIKPHKMLLSGLGIRTAESIDVTSDRDDLQSSADLRFALLDGAGEEIAFTHITLTPEQYALWETYAPDFKTGAHRICAAMLNLTIA